jgi:hypothetical protein
MKIIFFLTLFAAIISSGCSSGVNNESKVTHVNPDAGGDTNTPFESPSIRGIVNPGGCLTLNHNLGRTDLTFDAMYFKNGFVYDYTQVPYEFLQKLSNTNIISGSFNVFDMAALPNGNIVFVYNDSGDGFKGKFIIYNQYGGLVKSSTTFYNNTTTSPSVVGLNNGNILIAYSDNAVDSYGKYVIYSSDGNTELKTATVFHTNIVTDIHALRLSSGNIALVDNYTQPSFTLYNADMTAVIKSTATFGVSGALTLRAAPLKYGGFAATYISPTVFYSYYTLYDNNGSNTKADTQILAYSTGSLTTAGLNSGGFAVTYSSNSSGCFRIYDQAGSITKSETIFNQASTAWISVCGLNNGNFTIAFCDNSAKGNYVVYDGYGNLVIPEGCFYNAVTSDTKTAALGLNNFSIAGPGYLFGVYGQASLDLQIIDSNSVKLWNHTSETLDLILSVNQ